MKPNEDLDPVVDRVRAARAEIARQCDYDVDRMFELFKSMQAQHPERLWKSSDRRENIAADKQ